MLPFSVLVIPDSPDAFQSNTFEGISNDILAFPTMDDPSSIRLGPNAYVVDSLHLTHCDDAAFCRAC